MSGPARAYVVLTSESGLPCRLSNSATAFEVSTPRGHFRMGGVYDRVTHSQYDASELLTKRGCWRWLEAVAQATYMARRYVARYRTRVGFVQAVSSHAVESRCWGQNGVGSLPWKCGHRKSSLRCRSQGRRPAPPLARMSLPTWTARAARRSMSNSVAIRANDGD